MRKLLLYVFIPTVCVVVLYFVVGKYGFSFLITSVKDRVSTGTSDLFSAYASMFGALVTVFVALFAFEKWMDRKAYETLKKDLDDMKKKQEQFDKDLEGKIDDKIPDRIREFVKKNERTILDPMTRVIANQQKLVSAVYFIEFLESSFDSFARSLSGKEKSSFVRSLFNELVKKIMSCENGSDFEYFEKSINLLLKMSIEFENEDFVIDDDKEFAKNMDYVWYLLKRIQYLESARDALKMQHQHYEDLEQAVERIYRKNVSYPRPLNPELSSKEKVEM